MRRQAERGDVDFITGDYLAGKVTDVFKNHTCLGSI